MADIRNADDVPLIRSRVNHLLDRLSQNRSLGSYRTQEEVDKALFSIFDHLSRGHDKNIYDIPDIVKGTDPDLTTLNTFIQNIFHELEYLFEAVTDTGKVIESNFNFGVSRIKKLQGDLKYCNQQLAVCDLYSKDKDRATYFAETFVTLDNIDVGSRFISGKECFIDLIEGTVLLPKSGDEEKRKITKVVIGEKSNCNIGNNVEANVPTRGNINALFDNNQDTWVEFERIVEKEDNTGLSLELKISLESSSIVNGIRITPVLFGARTAPLIDSFEVSKDGKTWVSIKDDISVATFIGETEENRFHFAPHSSKFAGEFSITFAPRYIQFARIVIKQQSSIPIVDVYQASHLRYVIGIKEIEFIGNKFESTGELISKQLRSTKPIQAIALESLVDPVSFPVATGSASYYLSFDDGASWTPISPQGESSLVIPEVVFPSSDISAFRYKTVLAKDESLFAQYRQEQERKTKREIHTWPGTAPFTIKLKSKPIEGTLTICEPEISTRGSSYPKLSLGFGSDSKMSTDFSKREGATVLKKKLPIRELKKTSDVQIEVDGHLWENVSDFASSSWYSKVFKVSRTTDGYWQAEFGNGATEEATSPKGMIPSSNQEIVFSLAEENVTVETSIAPYVAVLDYSTNGEKNDTTIYVEGGEGVRKTETITPGVTSFQVSEETISSDSEIIIQTRNGGTIIEKVRLTPPSTTSHTGSGCYSSYKTFINGTTELGSSGDWTIDFTTGTIYFSTLSPLHPTYQTTVNYVPSRDIYLNSTDWDFVEGSLNTIQVYQSGYHTLEGSIAVSANARIASLVDGSSDRVWGIVPKSVRLSSGLLGSTVPTEVPFQNGSKEFEDYASRQDELVPAEVPTLTGSGRYIADFQLTQYQNFFLNLGVEFSDTTTFVTEVVYIDGDSELTSVGYYSIDPDTGTVYVRLTDITPIPSGGTVSYSYTDLSSQQRVASTYSVDIRNGIVYFASQAAITGTVTFKYAPYKARYVISRQFLEGEDLDYTSNIEQSQITINAAAKLEREQSNKLSISYSYYPEVDNVKELAKYFSPMLRALAVKVGSI